MDCFKSLLPHAGLFRQSHLDDAGRDARRLSLSLWHRAAHIRDLACGRHASDIEWIAFLRDTGEDWIVVTGDQRIHRNKAERAAFRQAGLKGVVLASAYQKTPINQQAAFLLWRWPDIEGLIATLAPPFLIEMPISRAGRLRVLPV